MRIGSHRNSVWNSSSIGIIAGSVMFCTTPRLKAIKIVTESNSFELPQSVSDPIIDRVMAKLQSDHK